MTKKHVYLSNFLDTPKRNIGSKTKPHVCVDHWYTFYCIDIIHKFTVSSISDQKKWHDIHWKCNLIIFNQICSVSMRPNIEVQIHPIQKQKQCQSWLNIFGCNITRQLYRFPPCLSHYPQYSTLNTVLLQDASTYYWY